MHDTSTPTGPAYVITALGAPVTAFSIDGAGFDAWATARGDELEAEVPARYESTPAATLEQLVYEARTAGFLISDPRLQLELGVDDSDDSCGFYLFLLNRGGTQREVRLASRWIQLWFPNDEPTDTSTARDHALAYLSDICLEANALLTIVGLLNGPDTDRTDDGIVISRDRLDEWAGRELSDSEVDRLKRAIPCSSIPEAIGTIADSFVL